MDTTIGRKTHDVQPISTKPGDPLDGIQIKIYANQPGDTLYWAGARSTDFNRKQNTRDGNPETPSTGTQSKYTTPETPSAGYTTPFKPGDTFHGAGARSTDFNRSETTRAITRRHPRRDTSQFKQPGDTLNGIQYTVQTRRHPQRISTDPKWQTKKHG